MEHASQDASGHPATAPAPQPVQRPGLTLVTSRFQLARPAEPAPDDWRKGLDLLLGWIGIDAEFVEPAPARRRPRMADWAMPSATAARSAPVFAPWLGWSPAALQHGGMPGLPAAQFVTSYLLDHSRSGGAAFGAGAGQGGFDIALLSPHPALCSADEPGGAPLPRPATMRMMINAAKAEGRERLAIILHARQRNAIARQLLAADRALTRQGLAIEILTIEDALPPLMAGRPPWDAIIAMPDLRSTVFTLLAETSGVRGPWPMLWYSDEGARGLRRVTCEAPGEGAIRLALDAPALIHALALVLHHAGCARAAWRLHEAWSRLRDSGVTTAGRGTDAPYVNAVGQAEFLAMLCAGNAVSQRPVRRWRALGQAQEPIPGILPEALRVVITNQAPCLSKERS